MHGPSPTPGAGLSVSPDRPVHDVHPEAIVLATIAAAWFVFAMAASFARNVEGGYLLAIVIGFSVIFFALTLGLAYFAAHDPRVDEPPTAFARFVEDDVAIDTGVIAGREALLQILVLPVALAVGGTAIGIVFLIASRSG